METKSKAAKLLDIDRTTLYSKYINIILVQIICK